ncbi:hypothetical protein E2C01_099342 [Portunus trituberculatus]|uniref:Uncharacterized protein n=1 Tax=Portunus trituberculatus TaxID=210409 RepID=A0A5B7KAJ6_PORTR|nr:hypothetical protein [Portunus trituberculatus]
MRCRSGEVLGEVDPTVVQEALCSLVEAWTSTDFPESRACFNTSAGVEWDRVSPTSGSSGAS